MQVLYSQKNGKKIVTKVKNIEWKKKNKKQKSKKGKGLKR